MARTASTRSAKSAPAKRGRPAKEETTTRRAKAAAAAKVPAKRGRFHWWELFALQHAGRSSGSQVAIPGVSTFRQYPHQFFYLDFRRRAGFSIAHRL